ncbi:MAG: GGDEF domain-containing protein [Ilumatobacter sp.]|jgi:diguanylate cyclase (GGDEF)-like protein|uniref:GGDEF domain-containing protein n=1 Tax=Ilumatobacter sp. TaxID=1967498 RepID=UPI0039190249
MTIESSEELTAAARRMSLAPDDDVVTRIDAAIAATSPVSDPAELGKLLVARCVALQGRGDASLQAASAREAVPYLVAAGEISVAAFASSMAAVFLDQIGESAAAVDHVVDALVMLADLSEGPEPIADVDAVRAALGVSGFFMRLGAFELAVDSGRHAFEGARHLAGVPVDPVAYSFGYMSVEAAYATKDPIRRACYMNDVTAAIEWLRRDGVDEVSRTMLADGLAGEAAVVVDEPMDRMVLDAAERHYRDAAPDLVAWHRLVRAMHAARQDAPGTTVELLDLAIPGLEASADNHCLARALEERSRALAALGQHDRASADALRLARLSRAWHLEQVGRLGDQIRRRAELERSSSVLRDIAERLADDIDRDALTGVKSRRWLDRRLSELERTPGLGVAMMFDIDHFKVVNDTFGHHVGDDVLARFAELLRVSVGPAAAVARVGGEEFVVVMCDLDVVEVGDDVASLGWSAAERVRLTIATHDWESIASGLELTVSGGVAVGVLSDVRQLLVEADARLLDAKRLGRNRVVVRPLVAT